MISSPPATTTSCCCGCRRSTACPVPKRSCSTTAASRSSPRWTCASEGSAPDGPFCDARAGPYTPSRDRTHAPARGGPCSAVPAEGLLGLREQRCGHAPGRLTDDAALGGIALRERGRHALGLLEADVRRQRRGV